MVPIGIWLSCTAFWFDTNKKLIAMSSLFFKMSSTFIKLCFIIQNYITLILGNIKVMYIFSILKMKCVTESQESEIQYLKRTGRSNSFH